MAGQVKIILEKIGKSALEPVFRQQRIDSIETCKILTDDDLRELGIATIGDRVAFRDAVNNTRSESHETETGEPSRRSMVMQLFRPTRTAGTGGRSRKKNRSTRTWTANFFCLADKNASRPPKTTEKLALQKAGLGLKKIQLNATDNEEDVRKAIMSDQGFPQLKDIGGFELLYCQSNCRDLQFITCCWSVESLRKVIGTQTKIYIRPIQRNMIVVNSTEEQSSNLTDICGACLRSFPLSQLRDHVALCHAPHESGEEDDGGIAVSTPEVVEHVPLQTEDMDATIELTGSVSTIYVQEGTVTIVEDHVDSTDVPTDRHTESLSEIVDQIVNTCKESNLNDPIEILRLCQSKIVQGRKLEIDNEADSLTGDTNFVNIDRENFLQTTIDEISGLTDLRLCLEVQFFGEIAQDFGGPRKEFFAIAMREMKEQYFQNIREYSKDYVVMGKIMALSMLQNGALPRVMSADILEEVFDDNRSSRPCIIDLRNGLDSLGIFQLVQKLPILRHLFTPMPPQKITYRLLTTLIKPLFSEEGSNRRQRERNMYTFYLKYLREVAGGRRQNVELSSILRFTTGCEEEPPLGYGISPSIQFVEGTSFLPTASTCINRMNLTIPDTDDMSLGEDYLFTMFDYAYTDAFFGLK